MTRRTSKWCIEATTDQPDAAVGPAVDVTERIATFEAAVRAADPSIRFVIARLVGRETDDVLQSAYLKAFRAWSAFRGDASPATWLHRIAFTTAMDHLRQQQRRPQLAREADDDLEAAHGADVASQVSVRLDIESALGRLSVDQRAVLLLVDAQDRTHAEVAEILGVPVGTIASRTHRARIALRALLTVGSET